MRFSWSEGSQSVANNTTVVNWSLTLIADGYGRISTSNARPWAVTFNGVNYSGSSSAAVANSSTTTLASGSTTVTHGSDGTKSASYSFSYNFSGITFSGTALGLVSGSGTAALTRIPRASSITVPKFTMGTAGSIAITRADSGFTHTLTWKFGSASGTIATKTTATSVSWTPATATLAPQIPKATSGTGTITCTTYSGSTAIGTSSVSFTATVPAGVVPSISSVTVKEATSGLAAKFGVFVQNRSTFAVSVSAAGSNGSTVTAITTKFQGVNYSGASFTAAQAATSGSLSMTTTVTDSRGRTATKTTAITVVAYANPAISAFTVSRCDADGNLDNAGSYVKIAYAYSVAPVNSKNTASARIDYKRTTATAWSSTALVTNTALSANTSVIPTTQFDPDYSYDFRLTLADYFTSTAYAAAISSQAVILDVLPDGTGVAFGKVAETANLLDSKWPIKTDGWITAAGTITAGGSKVLTEAEFRPSWYELGHASGANNITIPAAIWASAHEFLIEWKLGSDAPWGCLLVPKHASRTRYTDAYYYSADYYANVDFGVGPSGGETYISPTTGWIIGKYGNTDLAVSNLIYYVYWR